MQNLTWERDVVAAPNGQEVAGRLTATDIASGGVGDVVQWIPLKGNTTYTFSVWLWAPKPKTINLTVKYHFNDRSVAKRQFTLTPQPVRYWVTGATFQDGLYDVNIGRTPYPDDRITFGAEEGDFFYAWGAQLEEGEKMTNYETNEKMDPDSVRVWRPWLLVVNFLVLATVLCMLFKRRAFWFKNRVGVGILGALLVATIEGIAIIPEQRFVISLMVFLWLITALSVVMLCQKARNTFLH
jgi:hypothetical protein